jgi:hypothetical protein
MASAHACAGHLVPALLVWAELANDTRTTNIATKAADDLIDFRLHIEVPSFARTFFRWFVCEMIVLAS